MIPFSSAKAAGSAFSQVFTPMTRKGSADNSSERAWRPGMAMAHGPHHVAQKSRTTTSPRRSDRLRVSPSVVWRVQSGASLPISSTAL